MLFLAYFCVVYFILGTYLYVEMIATRYMNFHLLSILDYILIPEQRMHSYTLKYYLQWLPTFSMQTELDTTSRLDCSLAE